MFLIQFEKLWVVSTWRVIGINLWFVPQISEHWPKYNPGLFGVMLMILRRPGEESAFTPIVGMVHECNTSEEEINIWAGR